MTLMLRKYQFKKKPYRTKNTLLDIMIMMLLDHYVQEFHK